MIIKRRGTPIVITRQAAISYLTAVVQLALAVNVLYGHSPVVTQFKRVDITAPGIAGTLLAGSALLLMFRNSIMFIFATLPYILYVVAAAVASIPAIDRGASGTIVVYVFSMIQMYLLYFYEGG